MASSVSQPQIQVINRSDFRNHHLVTLPADPLPEGLQPSQIRVKTSLFSLTTNNITYARLGNFVGWWDFHPLPSNTPAPFNDPEKWGRINCWGVGEVTKSNAPELAPVGTKMYGYWPMGTLETDHTIKAAEVTNQYIEISGHRQHIMPVYNRYYILPKTPEPSLENQGWDALMRVLYETGYLINRFVFSWSPSDDAAHGPILPSSTATQWNRHEDADIKDAVVLVVAASGKTAMGFAHGCRALRPRDQQPKALIAVGSPASRSLVQGLGYYDDVVEYSDDPAAIASRWSLDKSTRLVILDFGGRAGAGPKWTEALSPMAKSTTNLLVGYSPSGGADPGANGVGIMSNADEQQRFARELGGDERYFSEFEGVWSSFKDAGGIKGVELKIEEGMEAFMQGWEDLAGDKVGASTALLYKL